MKGVRQGGFIRRAFPEGGPNNAILLVCARPYLSIKKREIYERVYETLGSFYVVPSSLELI